MKRFAIAVIAGALLLAGCSVSGRTPADGSGEDSAIKAYNVPLSDGESVLCVVYTTVDRGGLSCDWDGTRTEGN